MNSHRIAHAAASRRRPVSSKDRIPVHQRLPQPSEVEDDEETPRSQDTRQRVGFVAPKRPATAATGKRIKAKPPNQLARTSLEEVRNIRPRSAMGEGVSIDELFYRTYMSMQKTLEAETKQMIKLKHERTVSNSLVRSSVGESAMWFTARRAPKIRPTVSTATRLSLCSMKAAIAFLMLYFEVTRKRRVARRREEEEQRRAEQEESDRLKKEEEALGNRAMGKLVDVLASRVQAEKEWLADRERRRIKPLTDLVQEKEAVDKECKSWPHRINELQLARKQGRHIEKRTAMLVQNWWQRSRASCAHVWPDGDNPFKDRGGQPAVKAHDRSARSRSPAREGQRSHTPSRASRSSHGQRPTQHEGPRPNTTERDKMQRDLPDLIELFREKLFDSDGDMSYKTLDFLQRCKEKHIVDRKNFNQEAGQLERDVKAVSDAADAELVPHEARHAAELSKLEKQLQAEQAAAEERLEQPRQERAERERELEALKDKCEGFKLTVEQAEEGLQAAYARVQELDDFLLRQKMLLSEERQRLRQLLASRRAANALNMSADFAKEGRREHMEALEAKVDGIKQDLADREAKRAGERRMMLQLELEGVRVVGGFTTDSQVAEEYRRQQARIEEVRSIKAEVARIEAARAERREQRRREEEARRLRELQAEQHQAAAGDEAPNEQGATTDEAPTSSQHDGVNSAPNGQNSSNQEAAGNRGPLDGTAEEAEEQLPVIPPVLSDEQVYAVVLKYVDDAEEDVSLAEAAAHVHVRYPWVERRDWEDRLEGLYERAFEESQQRTATITAAEQLRLVKLELGDYGYAQEEMDGFALRDLQDMLRREKGE